MLYTRLIHLTTDLDIRILCPRGEAAPLLHTPDAMSAPIAD